MQKGNRIMWCEHMFSLNKIRKVFSGENKNSLINWGELRRLQPVSDVYGLDRGQAIDRYYIENFLEEHGTDITGTVLELHDSDYTDKYGDTVLKKDVLDINTGNENATIITDLAKADVIEDETYDCFILTQTLQYIYDLRSAIFHSHRILKKGGVILATVPSISRIDCVAGIEGDYWRFTKASVKKIFSEFFNEKDIEVNCYGNVLVATGFIMGLAANELEKKELDLNDPDFPVLICIRAVKKS